MSKAKHGLGKGLSALIRPAQQLPQQPPPKQTYSSSVAEEPVIGSIAQIEITRIRPNPFQPRADFDQQALDELKDSIQRKGIIQPVTVRRSKDGMYDLISGERRLRASTEIGLETIPAYIIDVKHDEDMLELALIENLQREHLNPIEIAISYQRLSKDVGLSPDDIASKVSKDRTTVVNFLRLLKLPEKIQHALRKNDVTMGHARALIALPDERVQLKLFEKIVKKGLNVRQVERLVREFGKKSERKSPLHHRRGDSTLGSIEERIQQILGTRVKINVQDGGRGEITVEFYSSDDLERLFDLFSTIRS
ncbi:MAG TPA: ParB/RepB/Spo0J family partition protein [Bacteroidota bacterium]|nr:ParB/RepB/Spo0J family partition protein [Bacteroidota bacterium]